MRVRKKKKRQSAVQFAFFTESLFFFFIFFACLAAVDGQPLYLIELDQSFSFNPAQRADSQMPNATLPLKLLASHIV